MKERRISGYLHETERYRPENRGERIPLARGDAVYFRGMYFRVQEITPNSMKGTVKMELSCFRNPTDARDFIRWCRNNPHKVKRIDDIGRMEV